MTGVLKENLVRCTTRILLDLATLLLAAFEDLKRFIANDTEPESDAGPVALIYFQVVLVL